MKGTPSHSNTEQRPLGWSQDKLSEFIESTRQNQFATFANMQPAYSVLREIDDCLQITAENLSNPKDILAALLLFRSHSAYRAACAMAMGTQLPETFVLLRSSLEYAGYALHISKHAELGEVWLRRHDDTVAMSAMKKAFMGVNIENAVGAVDKELGRLYKELYQQTIDFGGHPNERGLSGSLRLEESSVKREFQGIYLHADPLYIMHAMKASAQIGICCLHIFQSIFRERFMLLGLQERILQLRGSEQIFSQHLATMKRPKSGK